MGFHFQSRISDTALIDESETESALKGNFTSRTSEALSRGEDNSVPLQGSLRMLAGISRADKIVWV